MPSWLPNRFTNAPNAAVFTTVPSKTSPTFASRVRAEMRSCTRFAASASALKMRTVPSSSMVICAPIASSSRICLPPGPMTVPIFSELMRIVRMRGA